MHLLESAKKAGDIDTFPAFLQTALLCTCTGCHPQRCDKSVVEESFATGGPSHTGGLDVVQILSELPPDSGRPEELSDYVMLRELGKGNFARVWLVRHIVEGNLYALKIHNRWSIQQERSATTTDTERRVLERMSQHPFVVHLCRAFNSSTSLYYVMEFCTGGNLAMRIRRQGRLDEAALRFYGAEILLALQALHRENVVYKALRPENILLDGGGHIRLCDFSFAQEDVCETTPNQNAGLTRNFGLGGEPPLGFSRGYFEHQGLFAEYAPPELAEGYSYAKVADLYTFGVLLYECLVGRVPRRYSFDVAPSIDPPQDASPKAADLLRGLLHKSPSQRLGAFRGAAEVREHGFFGGVVWEDVLAKRLRPPFVPDDNHTTTLSATVAEGENPGVVASFLSRGAPGHPHGIEFMRSLRTPPVGTLQPTCPAPASGDDPPTLRGMPPLGVFQGQLLMARPPRTNALDSEATARQEEEDEGEEAHSGAAQQADAAAPGRPAGPTACLRARQTSCSISISSTSPPPSVRIPEKSSSPGDVTSEVA